MSGTPSAAAKTWGPFNGRQLTVMFVAVAVVFFPSAAWAVDTFSNVAIQDPVSGVKAAVDSSRRLQVNGSVSGSTVYAIDRPASTSWNYVEDLGPYGSRLVTGPSAVPINVTSLSFGFQYGSTSDLILDLYSVPSASTSCYVSSTWRGTLYRLGDVNAASGPFAVEPPTLVARPAPGTKLCVFAVQLGDATISLNVSGYNSA